MKRILFFTPFGGVSGSELLLLRTIQHLDPLQFKAAVYCEQAGVPMQNALPNEVPFFTNPFHATKRVRLASKLKQAIGISVFENYLADIQATFKADYWYLNTVMMAHIAPLAQKMGIKIISHFHELPHIHFEPVHYDHLKAMIDNAVLCIGNAEITCQKLRILGAKSVGLVYPFVEFNKIQPNQAQIDAIREALLIPKSSFTWAIAGAPIFVKGIEHLPALAQHFPSCHFVWIGKNTNSGSYFFTEKEIESRGLTNIHFVGLQTTNYYNHLAVSDGLLLLSKEESFGMVNLEAAYLGKPVVAFNSGGVTEIVQKGMGKVVDSWNLQDLIAAMEQVMDGSLPFDPKVAQTRIQEFTATRQMDHWTQLVRGLR